MSLDTTSLDPHDTVASSPYSDLPMDELLAARGELRDHEEQLSYWRRVVQGRLDLLDARLSAGATPPLPLVLAGSAQHATRTAHSPVRHVASMPELAVADRAWDLASCSADVAVVRHAAQRLRVTERWLSEQRMSVLASLDAATAVLLDRLHDDPEAYLRCTGARWVASAG